MRSHDSSEIVDIMHQNPSLSSCNKEFLCKQSQQLCYRDICRTRNRCKCGICTEHSQTVGLTRCNNSLLFWKVWQFLRDQGMWSHSPRFWRSPCCITLRAGTRDDGSSTRGRGFPWCNWIDLTDGTFSIRIQHRLRDSVGNNALQFAQISVKDDLFIV